MRADPRRSPVVFRTPRGQGQGQGLCFPSLAQARLQCVPRSLPCSMTSSWFLGTSSSVPPAVLWCLMRWFLVISRLLQQQQQQQQQQHPHRPCIRPLVNPLSVTCSSDQTRTTRHLPATRTPILRRKLLRLIILTEHGTPLSLGLSRPDCSMFQSRLS